LQPFLSVVALFVLAMRPPDSWMENVIELRRQDESKPIIHPKQRRTVHHYHLFETRIGDPLSYRDDVFTTRRRASDEARTRIQWLAAAGLHVETVTGSRRRYLGDYFGLAVSNGNAYVLAVSTYPSDQYPSGVAAWSRAVAGSIAPGAITPAANGYYQQQVL